MVKRILQKYVIKASNNFSVVWILDVRQVGKTTLVKEIQKDFNSSVHIDLELPSYYNKLENAEIFLKNLEDRLEKI